MAEPQRLQASAPHAGASRISLPWAMLGAVLLLIFFLDLVGVESRATASPDRSFELWVHGVFGRSTFGLFDFLSFIGGATVRIAVTAVIVLALFLYRQRWSAIFVVLTLLGSLWDEIGKLLVRRPRPHLFAGAEHATGYSFPSGHSTSSVVFLVGLAVVVWYLTGRRSVGAIATVLAILLDGAIGLSRIVLGVHFPTDVIGGFALGGAWIAFLLAALRPRTGRGI